MSRWVPRTSVTGIRYGQADDKWYWDYNYNPGAYYDPSLQTYDLALPNCTTYAYGRVREMGAPAPISGWHNASAWHAYLINGWTYEAYAANKVKVGDILEWTGSSTRNHVAVVEKIENGTIYVSQSYYCDDNGQATANTRSYQIWGSTKASVDAYGYSHWPGRYFNYGVHTSADLGNPDYILHNPVSYDEGCRFIPILNKNRRRRRRINV